MVCKKEEEEEVVVKRKKDKAPASCRIETESRGFVRGGICFRSGVSCACPILSFLLASFHLFFLSLSLPPCVCVCVVGTYGAVPLVLIFLTAFLPPLLSLSLSVFFLSSFIPSLEAIALCSSGSNNDDHGLVSVCILR